MVDQSQELAERIIPELRNLASELIDVCGELGALGCITGNTARSKKARARLMAILYAGAQQEHMASVLTLSVGGQHRDAWLISRSMIEGFAQLSWATSGDLSGCTEWFGYFMVESWRQFRVDTVAGRSSPPDDRRKVVRFLRKHGHKYFTEKALAAARRNRPLPDDPYRHQWNALSAWAMFDEIGIRALYRSVYAPSSGWAHWNPLELSRALSTSTRGREFEAADSRREAMALMVGISCTTAVHQIAAQCCGFTSVQQPLHEIDARLGQIMNQDAAIEFEEST